MKDVAIFALTTGGLVQIQRITHERAPLSMMVVGRGSERLSISDRYDDFVYPGGGPVERFFGPFPKGGFRLEVSDPINSGDSWQLAAFMAHAVLADEACHLCRDVDEADTILCLTGLVDFDGLVGGVGHIPEKLHAARSKLNEWQAAGRSPIIVVPSGPDHERALAADITEGISVLAGINVADLGRDFGIPFGQGEIAAVEAVQPQPKRRRPGELVLMALVLAVGAYVFLSQPEPAPPPVKVARETPPPEKPPEIKPTVVKPPVAKPPPVKSSTVIPAVEKPAIPLAPAIKLPEPNIQVSAPPKPNPPIPKARRTPPVQELFTPKPTIPKPTRPKAVAAPPTTQPPPPPNPVSLAVLERHAPHGYQCEHVYFGKAQADVLAVPLLGPQQAKPSEGLSLCGLLLRMELGEMPVYAMVKVEMLQGRMVGTRHPPSDLSGRRLVKGRRDWSIDLPFLGTGPVRYRLTLVTSTKPIRDDRPADGGELKTASLLHEISR